MWAGKLITGYLQSHTTAVAISPDTALDEVLDSLGFIDFFLYLEQHLGAAISLDGLAQCRTVGSLSALLESRSTAALLPV